MQPPQPKPAAERIGVMDYTLTCKCGRAIEELPRNTKHNGCPGCEAERFDEMTNEEFLDKLALWSVDRVINFNTLTDRIGAIKQLLTTTSPKPPVPKMRKFRKKPLVIEAVQFDGTNALTFERYGKPSPRIGLETWQLAIDTLEGTMFANHGDWIIRGVGGELYPCKPEIFEKSYEPVED